MDSKIQATRTSYLKKNGLIIIAGILMVLLPINILIESKLIKGDESDVKWVACGLFVIFGICLLAYHIKQVNTKVL